MSGKSVLNLGRGHRGPASRARRRPKPAVAARVAIEGLEGRVVPAYMWYGNLVIDGTNAADVVSVRSSNPGNLNSSIKVVENGVTQYFPRAAITGQIHFRGYGGDDVFNAYTFAALQIVADGGAGNDTISGGVLADILSGGGDNDTLYGNEGGDTIYGNAGIDIVFAGDGHDFVFGGDDTDYLYGEAHNDQLYGEFGVDYLYGGDGNDNLMGDSAAYPNAGWYADFLHGGMGDDILAGQNGNDQLFGEGGSDTLYGNDGDDILYGDTWYDAPNTFGNDLLFGGGGHDFLSGEGGNDRLHGEMGIDQLYGKDGNDTLFGDNWGNNWGGEAGDVIYGGDGDDYLYGEGGNDELSGDLGTDRIFGGDGDDHAWGDIRSINDSGWETDYLYGGNDNDTLAGQGGDDWIEGNSHSDVIYGNNGGDYLYGSDIWGDDTSGNDVLFGGFGNDKLHGSAGDDGLYGEGGWDFLYGYDGHDTLYGDNWGHNWGSEGDDWLYGGRGNDNLYGEGGRDKLHGEAGNDGLFAGAWDGGEVLYGGSGADRFLIPVRTSDGSREDRPDDFGLEDALITFQESPPITDLVLNGQDETFSFAAGGWDNAQITRVDAALANLHALTGNTRLLKPFRELGLNFLAVGAQTSSNDFYVSGWNTGSKIAIVDIANKSTMELMRNIYHEVGHDFDDERLNSFIDEFRDVSGWIEDSVLQPGYTPSPGSGDTWQYRTSADRTFANDYARTNPYEDFAMTFEAYVLNVFHGGTYGLVLNGAKKATLDLFFNEVRSWD